MKNELWDAYQDEQGYTYYQNRLTNETAWEIPQETEGKWTFGGVNDDGSFYFINSITGECVNELPSIETTSSSPESQCIELVEGNSTSHDNTITPEVTACMDDLIHMIEVNLKDWSRRRQRNAKSLQKQRQKRPKANLTTAIMEAKRFEHTDVYATRRAEMDAQLREDEVAKEVLRVKDRFVSRRKHQLKQAMAWNRASIKDEQNKLRLHFTRVLVAKATNGLDVQGKINLSSEDAVPESTVKKVKEELFESMERAEAKARKNEQLETLFITMDEARYGSLSPLYVLHQLTTKVTIQPFVQSRRGLRDLVCTGILQAFLLQMDRLAMYQFVNFVEIMEDVVIQVDRIQGAIEQAGLGIVTPELASWNTSILNAKTNEVFLHPSRRQNTVNRLTLSFDSNLTTCQGHVRHISHFRGQALEGTKIWQLGHKHVYIQLQPSLPIYCVHCRRTRTWLKKLERYETEASHRATWGRSLSRRMYDIEMQLRECTDSPVPDIPSITSAFTQSSSNTVKSVLDELVHAVELLNIYSEWEERILAPHIPTKISNALLHRLTKHREAFELEELNRACLFEEDELSRESMERMKISLEIPLIAQQEAAHKEFVWLLQACLDPSVYLKRLHFERVLAVRSSRHEMVLRMIDGATNTRCILHTIRCSTSEEAQEIVFYARQLETLKPPHIVEIKHAFMYTYQHFSPSGNLNECWPIVFVAIEDCSAGTWLPTLPPFQPLLPQDILHIVCTASAAISSLHAQGLYHFNLNAWNLYRGDDGELKVGGFLAFKHPYTMQDICDGARCMPHLINVALVPPEVDSEKCTMNEKTDIWALGCVLYVLLTGSRELVRNKSLSTIMNEIPLRYGTSLRSCLRMLLQPNPIHRPTAIEIFNFLSCACIDEETTIVPNLLHKKKSIPSLEPLHRPS